MINQLTTIESNFRIRFRTSKLNVTDGYLTDESQILK